MNKSHPEAGGSPWRCCTCGADVPRERAGEEHVCTGCGRKLIVSRVGTTYPFTMMGLQAADGDELAARRKADLLKSEASRQNRS